MDIKSVYLDPHLYQSSDPKAPDSPITYECSIHNESPVDLYVMNNQNLPIFIKGKQPTQGYLSSKKIIIRSSYIIRGQETITILKKDIEKRLDLVKESGELNDERSKSYMELQIINQAINSALGHNPNAYRFSIYIDRIHTSDRLLENGIVLCSDSGLLLFCNQDQSQVVHPYSLAARNIHPKKTVEATSPGTIAGLFLVDKNKIVGKKFITIGKAVYEVPVKNVEDLQDGFHFSIKEDSDAVMQKSIVPLDKLSEVGLFSSREEAIGNFSHEQKTLLTAKQLELETVKSEIERIKLETEQLRHSNELEKQKMMRDKQESEHALSEKIQRLDLQKREMEILFDAREKQAKEDHQREIARIKLEQNSTENQMSRQKLEIDAIFKGIAAHREDYYERRSLERRDTSEIVKYGLPIAAGIIGGMILRDKFN